MEVLGDGAGSVDLWFADEQSIREKYWHPEAGDVVLDVGSSIGSWTLPALIWGARVYAVEPRADSQALTRGICDANDQIDPDQLIIVQAALSEEGGYPDDLSAAIGYRDGFDAPLDATYMTLDKMVAEYEISQVDWIKVDVEGCELSVLRGSVDTLRKFRPIVIVEDHTGIYPWVGPMRIRDQWQDLMRDLKYEMTPDLYTESPGNIDRYFWNCIPK
jgi:FkbM family methyltransferase